MEAATKQAKISKYAPSYKDMLAAQATADAQAAVDKARAMLPEAQPLVLKPGRAASAHTERGVAREVREQAEREQSIVDALGTLVALLS